MSHLAAVIPSAKAPLEVRSVPTPKPGAHELLVKNELIGLIPLDAKIAKAAMFPLSYPAILGSSFGGIVTAVGEGVTGFQIGDRVAAAKGPGSVGDVYSAFQQYVLVEDITTSNVPKEIDLNVAVSLIGNLSTVVGLVTLGMGLVRPDLEGSVPARNKKVLIYGGTSSVGSISVQYVAQAGYQVTTTTSPKHAAFVSKLGAANVVDHTQDRESLIKALIKGGPYDNIVDAISLPDTLSVTGAVASAQGGGNVYALLPPFGPETLPPGVSRRFSSWGAQLAEAENKEVLKWAFSRYLPHALAKGQLIPLPTHHASGGLSGLNEAIDLLDKGVSGVKVVASPWE